MKQHTQNDRKRVNANVDYMQASVIISKGVMKVHAEMSMQRTD